MRNHSSFKVHKGPGRPPKYPFRVMDKGESYMMPYSTTNLVNVDSLLLYYRRRYGLRFSVRYGQWGFIVERVA